MKEIKTVKKLNAVFQAPPSKAHTLRTLFIASLAEGRSVLKNALNAEDQQYAAKALNAFGAKIEFDGKDFVIEGTGGNLR
ncbi:MAG: 3-phosphoshikimate 1-carboxyvinyltransferase, partial [archaeon]|nr:3-phosphoshikimate 1-carboxyvinyltransferase [archaeon]